MGWYFSRQTRAQLIQELIQPQEGERAHYHVIAHALRGNVMWSVVRITAKESGIFGLDAGESTAFIRCDLLHSEDDSIYHTASFKGGDAAWYDPIMITDGGNGCPSLLNGKAKLPQGTPCVEIKNAGTQTDKPIYPWQGFALYCIA